MGQSICKRTNRSTSGPTVEDRGVAGYGQPREVPHRRRGGVPGRRRPARRRLLQGPGEELVAQLVVGGGGAEGARGVVQGRRGRGGAWGETKI